MMTPCYCTNLRLAARKLSAIYDTALEPFGINIAQYFLLRTIRNKQPVSLTEVGLHAELDRSTVGRNVRVLERMGLVQTRRSETDQREAQVSLSSDGSALMRDAEPIWESCQHRFVRRLGRDKADVLSALLEAI